MDWNPPSQPGCREVRPAGSAVGATGARRRFFGIDPRALQFSTRGFLASEPAVVAELERVGGSFAAGHGIALEDCGPEVLATRLDTIEPRYRGFAYEGAGLALELLDTISPLRRDRLPRFLAGGGASHTYMVHIGAGWLWARLRLGPDRRRRRLDPTLGWLALDGYGFHEGFFHTERTVFRQRTPRSMRGPRLAVFDAGLGRCLWFVFAADPNAIGDCIDGFPVERRADLWAGSGLACCYAGGVGDDEVARLVERAGRHRDALAQGAAFAAKARARAGIPTEHTERAVERICGAPVDFVAKVCDVELENATQSEPEVPGRPRFEQWRAAIRAHFARQWALDGSRKPAAEVAQ